jgi:hypothetical protein
LITSEEEEEEEVDDDVDENENENERIFSFLSSSRVIIRIAFLLYDSATASYTT